MKYIHPPVNLISQTLSLALVGIVFSTGSQASEQQADIGLLDGNEAKETEHEGHAADVIKSFEQQVSELLASESPSAQAWGAYYIGQHRLDSLAPSLESLLGGYLDADDLDYGQCNVLHACLDGLIQNGQAVDDALLYRVWAKGLETSAIMLAAADPDQSSSFLAAKLKQEMKRNMEENDESARYHKVKFIALCNLLMQGNGRLFVETSLPRIKRKLVVEIELPSLPEDNLPVSRSHTGGGSGSSLCGRPVADGESWPPLADYELGLSSHQADAFILSDGPQTVYAARTIDKNGAMSISSYWDNRKQLEYLRDSLVWMTNPSAWRSAQSSELFPLLEHYSHLVWESDEARFTKEIKAAAISLHSPWVQLAKRLKDKDYLPEFIDPDQYFDVDIDYVGETQVVTMPLPGLFESGALRN